MSQPQARAICLTTFVKFFGNAPADAVAKAEAVISAARDGTSQSDMAPGSGHSGTDESEHSNPRHIVGRQVNREGGAFAEFGLQVDDARAFLDEAVHDG